jgi:hypothetical protein
MAGAGHVPAAQATKGCKPWRGEAARAQPCRVELAHGQTPPVLSAGHERHGRSPPHAVARRCARLGPLRCFFAHGTRAPPAAVPPAHDAEKGRGSGRWDSERNGGCQLLLSHRLPMMKGMRVGVAGDRAHHEPSLLHGGELGFCLHPTHRGTKTAEAQQPPQNQLRPWRHVVHTGAALPRERLLRSA